MSCSTITNVRPDSFSARINEARRRSNVGLIPAAGSSSRITCRIEHQHLRELDELALSVRQVGRLGRDVLAHADELQELGGPSRFGTRDGTAREPSEPKLGLAAATFSSTVRLSKSRGSWYVRATPANARRVRLSPSSESAVKDNRSPMPGRYVPSTTLKTVVLPDPLGPINAVSEPARTLSDAPSSAVTPPKRIVTSSTTSRSSPGWTVTGFDGQE